MDSEFVQYGIYAALAITIGTIIFAYGKWHGNVNSDRANFRAFMTEIRNDIKDILKRLPPLTVTSASPIMLTELGENISKNINAADWAVAEARNLVSEAEGKSPYEIQSIAFDYADNFEPSADMRSKMQACAFEKGIELSGIQRVLGVELRDVLLKHFGLQQSSLDDQEQTPR